MATQHQNSQPINFSHIAHDLRNYLSGIHGLANIIKDNIESCWDRQKINGNKSFDRELKKVLEITDMLLPHCDEALHYVDDLLQESIAEKNFYSSELLSNFDVAALINELKIFHKNFADQNQVIIETEIADNLPLLCCDRFKLKNILINLITNAIKYNKIGGKLIIRAEHQLLNQEIVISVIDTGIGMSAKDLEMAISGQGKEIDKSKLIEFGKVIDSHGIGLPLAKRLTELQNGKLEIKSELGIGTEVLLKFKI